MSDSTAPRTRLAEWSYRHGSTALAVTDSSGVILHGNPAFANAAGRRIGSLPGTTLVDALRQPPKSHLVNAFREALRTGTGRAVISVPPPGPDPAAAQLQWRFRFEHHGRDGLVFVEGRDLTKERNLSAEVKARTVKDRLTGLDNRDAFVDELQTVLATGQSVALFIVDVDRFAAINDTYGHEFGDALLITVARRLAGLVGVRNTVARIGGDQFAVMARRLDDDAEAHGLAAKLHEVLTGQMVLQRTTVHLRLSIGFTFSEPNQKNASTLLREADTALMRAAELGGNRIQAFEPTFHDLIEKRVKTEADLRAAIGTSQLDADVQGVFTTDRRLVGFEALARWRHPTRGTVPPGEFIDVAGRYGLLDHVLQAVLGRSLAALDGWLAQSPSNYLAVNVAPSQLAIGDPIGIIHQSLLSSRAEPSNILVEVTERELVGDPDAIRILERLAARGFRIAIDDFGAGASSIGYLWSLPVSVLKLDRSLITSMGTDPRARTIVASLIELGHRLDLSIVAEGVETEDEYDMLTDMGHPHIQGYLMHRPCRLSEIDEVLEAKPAATGGGGPGPRVSASFDA